MNCQHWKLALFDLARGLDTDQTQNAMAHAKECSQCAIDLEEQRELTERLKPFAAEAKHQAAQNIPPVLLNAFRKSHSVEKRNRRFFIWARAAVLLVAIFGSWMWYRSYSETGSGVTPVSSDFQGAEYDGEFIPLQYGDHAVNSWQVVRVELESSALQELGFPRIPEWDNRPVQADIVVGDDGLPQAIRFVSLDQ